MIEINKIHNMDCIEGLKLMEDKSVDLVITDPFYVPKAQFEWETYDKWYWNWNKEWLSEIKRVLKDDFHLLISFSSDDMAKFEMLLKEIGFNIKSRMVWNYRNSCKAVAKNTKFAKTYEFIFHCSSGKQLNFSDKWDEKRFDVQVCAIPQSNFKEGKYHQYQKPLRLWKMLIEFASNKGDLVLDPFMGSGTTAIVCKQLKRNFVGFEIKKEYIDISNKRLNETVADLNPYQESLIIAKSDKSSEDLPSPETTVSASPARSI